MEAKDPLEQAREILEGVAEDAQVDIMAEQIKYHSEIVLLAAIQGNHHLAGHLMHKAHTEGVDYISGLVCAVGIIARNWGRWILSDPMFDFRQYVDEEEVTRCDTPAAHVLTDRILGVESSAEMDRVRDFIRTIHAGASAHDFARICVHLVGIFADLMNTILEIRESQLNEEHGEMP
jgi:hypothetical protein